jgi:hypothetical protein
MYRATNIKITPAAMMPVSDHCSGAGAVAVT